MRGVTLAISTRVDAGGAWALEVEVASGLVLMLMLEVELVALVRILLPGMLVGTAVSAAVLAPALVMGQVLDGVLSLLV